MQSVGQIKVLLVEDHPVTLEGLKTELSAQPDIRVVGTADTMKAAIELTRQLLPDAILLDLHLPDSPGPKALLRNFRAVTQAKIVVFTGEDRSIFVESIIEAGADAYVHKSKPSAAVARCLRDLMTGERTSTKIPKDSEGFSQAERQILRMLACGMKYPEIAKLRNSAPETVRKQCDRLQLKVNAKTREELIAWAVENGYGWIDE